MGAAWESVFGDMSSADPLDVVNAQAGRHLGRQPDRSATRTSRRSCSRRSTTAPRWSSSTRGARRWPSAADLHLAIRPGTDTVLALAIAQLVAAARHARPRVHRRARRRRRRVPGRRRGVDARRVPPKSPGSPPPTSCTLAEWWGTHPPGDAAHRLGPGAQRATAAPRVGRSLRCRCWSGTSACRVAV